MQNLAPRNAPSGKPMNNRSNKSEGMTKKLTRRNSESAKSVVENERQNNTAENPSAARTASERGACAPLTVECKYMILRSKS